MHPIPILTAVIISPLQLRYMSKISDSRLNFSLGLEPTVLYITYDIRPNLIICAVASGCRFAVAEGDLITYLNVWEAWTGAGEGRPSWAHRHCLNHKTLLRAADIMRQLCSYLRSDSNQEHVACSEVQG